MNVFGRINMKINHEPKYDYKNVFLIPQYGKISSRSEIDTSSYIVDKKHTSTSISWKLDVPVISANMDTVTDGNMALAISKAGAAGAIHRFMSIEENVRQFEMVQSENHPCFISIGVNEESKERAHVLYKAGARRFIIDIAHGHSAMMKEMIQHMRKSFGDSVFIMAGNTATMAGCLDLIAWGADAVKIGIGPGAVCTTKNVTGVTVPQFSAIADICTDENKAKLYKVYKNSNNASLEFPIMVADGGIQEIGDIAKAIGAGADMVMCGRLFASCVEAPGPRINGKKVYRGMASKDAMLTIKEASQLPTPEGISTVLEMSGETIAEVVKHIKGGLQSAISYSNAKNIKEFQSNAVYGVRKS
jgi:IMP dehydrogenase